MEGQQIKAEAQERKFVSQYFDLKRVPVKDGPGSFQRQVGIFLKNSVFGNPIGYIVASVSVGDIGFGSPSMGNQRVAKYKYLSEINSLGVDSTSLLEVLLLIRELEDFSRHNGDNPPSVFFPENQDVKTE